MHEHAFLHDLYVQIELDSYVAIGYVSYADCYSLSIFYECSNNVLVEQEVALSSVLKTPDTDCVNEQDAKKLAQQYVEKWAKNQIDIWGF